MAASIEALMTALDKYLNSGLTILEDGGMAKMKKARSHLKMLFSEVLNRPPPPVHSGETLIDLDPKSHDETMLWVVPETPYWVGAMCHGQDKKTGHFEFEIPGQGVLLFNGETPVRPRPVEFPLERRHGSFGSVLCPRCQRYNFGTDHYCRAKYL